MKNITATNILKGERERENKQFELDTRRDVILGK